MLSNFSLLPTQSFKQLTVESFSGILIGLQTVLVAFTLAIIIFSGDLVTYIPVGITTTLISIIILRVTIALKGSSPLILASVQETYVAIAAIIATDIATNMHTTTSTSPLPTIMVALILMTLLYGILVYLLGKFNLGNLIHFFPYPIIAGFLAAIGWQLFIIGISTIITIPITTNNFPQLIFSFNIWLIMIGLTYSIIMLIITKRYTNPLITLLLILIAFVVFYIILAYKHISLEQAQQLHLMLPTIQNHFKAGFFITQLNLISLKQIQWHMLLDHVSQFSTYLIIGTSAMLLKMRSYELIEQQPIAFNEHLKATGFANIITALCGGFSGNIALVPTIINRSLGTKTYLPAVMSSLLCAIFLFFNFSLLHFLPRIVFGILVLYVALDFMHQWLVVSWTRFSILDYIIILTIFSCIIYTTLLNGIVIGLLLSICLFAFRYSKINTVKNKYTHLILKSNVDRNSIDTELLNQWQGAILIIELQGYIYFGNMYKIIQDIEHSNNANKKQLDYLIIDFSHVVGIDSSAMLAFIKVLQVANANNCQVIFTGLANPLQQQIFLSLRQNNIKFHIELYRDLDHGLEWFENCILDKIKKQMPGLATISQENPLQKIIHDIQQTGDYLQRITKNSHEIIYYFHEAADNFYYIESGSVDILLKQNNKKPIRLRNLQAGTIIGEIGMYLGTERGALVRANQTCTLLCLTYQKLKQLELDYPSLALALQEQIIITLGKRLNYANNLLSHLS